MGTTYDAITEPVQRFIEDQHLFFVATAPTGPDGHVNVSPKGYDTFVVLGPNEVAYLDLTGSGAETVAHLRDNGRITIMFCAFEGKPNIVRLYGRGEAVVADDPRHPELAGRFTAHRGARAVIVVTVDRVQTSCGYSIPFLRYEGERDRLRDWADGKSDEELADYRTRKNATSIDGLPALGAV